MRKTFKKVLAATLSVCMIASTLFTSPMGMKTVKAEEFTSETITKNGFSLTIMQSTDSSKRISGQTLERIKEVYFTQYPKMRARYNPTRPRAIMMKFDPALTEYPAYTGGDMGSAAIRFSVNWLTSNPNDIDCATHELFHVVQGGYMNYNAESFEGAICEGIADYARSVYGLYNDLQGWSLGEYNSSQTILTRYASNARFLTWISYNKNSEATYMLNKVMHNGTYTADMWVQLTGMTSDQLWDAYAADPNIDKITLSTQKGGTFGITQGETYKIISAESGQALSVAGGSTADGANIQQEPYNGDASQQWEFRYLGNGQYNIVNKKSGKGLDVDNGGTADGTNIHQYPVENGGSNNQKWVIFERGNQYSLFPVCGNGVTVADLAGSSHDAGANIQSWQWNKSKAQSFIIEPVNGSDTSLSAFDRIEGEDYIEKCTDIKVSVDESEARSGGGNIGGLLAGAWTKYAGVVFDQDASAIEINYCNKSGDSYVDVYIDNMNGNPVGRIQTPQNSSDWNTYTTIKGDLTTRIPAGTHDVYLSFKNDSMQGYTQNCDYFNFIKYSGPSSYNGFSTINAVEYSEASGIVVDRNSNGEPQNIGGTHNGDWVRYDNVIFDDTVGKIELNYSCQRGSGGQVYVYVDNMDNTPAAMIDISETGSDWKTYKTVSADLKPTISSGSHTIYLKFVNNGGNVANVDWFQFTKYVETTTPEEPGDGIVISRDVKVEGYQISAILGGNRVIGSIESEINGKKVEKWGFVYGLLKANGKDSGITDEDMYVGSENQYVKSYESTSVGTLDKQMGASTTATYFVRTMLFPSYTAATFSAEYKVRAYAELSDGSIVYSDVSEYSIFEAASYLYKNALMNTLDGHQFLYNKILKVVDSNYQEEDYEWGNVIVRPDTW